MSKISVAMCTFNGQRFLAEQLESFLNQDRMMDELVVGDDNSSDETVSILESFASKAPFEVLLEVSTANKGSTKNFERTISRCTGDIIFLSDQDDVWMPEKIERFLAIFDKNPTVALAFSNAELINENGIALPGDLWTHTLSPSDREGVRLGKLFELSIRKNVVTGATMAFRSVWLDNILPIPNDIPNLIHDGWISMILAHLAGTVMIEEKLIKYRQHESQQLGIDAIASRPHDKESRSARFEPEISLVKNEILRLDRIEQIFKTSSQFQNDRWEDQIAIVKKDRYAQIEHLNARLNLPTSGYARLRPVIAEMMTGRYARFSKGVLSAAKDLIGLNP